MPLYDFECVECGERFEALVLPNGTEPACPACESRSLTQLLSMFSVSSQATRQANLNSARRQNKKAQRDWAVAQTEAERDHEH
jgi:putative FmdB family regulatory protein